MVLTIAYAKHIKYTYKCKTDIATQDSKQQRIVLACLNVVGAFYAKGFKSR